MEGDASKLDDSGNIKRIDRTTVHRICSGQVVVDLATAVKELVENSLDAKASLVEIKLKDLGLELIEVSDNGTGLKKDDYEGITTKYATSKLKSFSDLSNVVSFGFRGEAISSLCELSGTFSILTRTEHDEIGCKIVYDQAGGIISQSPAPRTVGTTVTITNLFEPLPVRRGEFARNIKKQYGRMLKVLQAYAIMSTMVRISVTNTKAKGKIQSVLTTQANAAVMDNVTNVFGAKFIQTLTEFNVSACDEFPEHPDLKNKDPGGCKDADRWTISGLVSRAGEGVGRSDNDRQFFYLNKRPVDLPKFTRALNDVWRQYEMNKKPACVINVELPPGTFDVNVTPDKRQIIIDNEATILEHLKAKLHAIFQPSRTTFHLNQASLHSFMKPDLLSSQSRKSEEMPKMFKKEIHEKKIKQTKEADEEDHNSPQYMRDAASETKPVEENCFNNVGADQVQSLPNDQETETISGNYQHTFCPAKKSPEEPQPGKITALSYADQKKETPHAVDEDGDFDTEMHKEKRRKKECSPSTNALKEGAVPSVHLPESSAHEGLSQIDAASKFAANEAKSSEASPSKMASELTGSHGFISEVPCLHSSSITIFAEGTVLQVLPKATTNSGTPVCKKAKPSEEDGGTAFCSPSHGNGKGVTLAKSQAQRQFCFDPDQALRESAEQANRKRRRVERMAQSSSLAQKLSVACSAEGKDCDAAAKAFARVLTKDHFTQMKVIGQFNLGFIIAQLHSDLFILDQHACDEKYNFETLQHKTTIHEQRLIRPLSIDVTAAEEMIIMDNLEVFKKNGFHFEVDDAAPTTSKLKITALPFSKNTQFGINDVHELASLLSENPESLVRLPKATAMFASRACRSSVMIGDALDVSQMTKLVHKMHEIDQPWNCPHGRPTMRHLADLDSLLNQKAF